MENYGVISKFANMSKEIIKRDVGQESFDCIIDVEYVPFPLEEKRREAYYTHAKLFLKAKERQLKEERSLLEANYRIGIGWCKKE